MKILILSILLLASAITSVVNPREANEAYNNGDYETAVRLYREALDNDPDNAKLHFNLGNALMMMGETDQAIVAYEQFMELAETSEEKALSEYNIGHFQAIAEQWQNAATRFKQALMLNPDDEDARYNYELALSKLQEQEQNQDQQDQEKPDPSEEAKRLKALAESLVDQRRYNEALNLMKEGLKADPTVAAFNDFIQRIENITQVNAN